jgi:maltooligosyltrehalose trehalohydrolase
MNTTRLGAEVIEGGTRFTAFASQARGCQVRFLETDGSVRATHALQPGGDGFFAAEVRGVGHGALYDLLVDGKRLPDPYARFLPQGVHGPAMVIAPQHVWRHGEGVTLAPSDRIIYELHVGTFTPEGTYTAAARRLSELAELGVTVLEVMPVSSFSGRWGWGYDGVAHFAPHPAYGTPDDLRAFVDEAHGHGLAVILDVVYNHFGPAGNYLAAFSPEYFTKEIQNAWGDALDFRHPAVRRYVLDNARMWLTDFRFDGLRLDATHAVVDPSERHILQDLADLAHGLTPRKFVVAEDERNDPAVVRRLGVDAQWADDFHHAAHVTVTGERDGYYAGYAQGTGTIADTILRGWLYEGQVYPATGRARGKPATGVPAEALVYCLQNHDQIGNRAFGDRLPTMLEARGAGVEPARALAAVLLFLPMTPMLFMGEEWAASSPFQYFTDHDAELGKLISRGRREEFQKFKAFSDPAARGRIPDPQAEDTFQRSKLRWEERDAGVHASMLALYKALISLRRGDPVLRVGARERLEAQGRGNLLLARRWGNEGDRMLVANLGPEASAGDVVARAVAGRRVLLRTDGVAGGSTNLPAWTALIAAGDGAEREWR